MHHSPPIMTGGGRLRALPRYLWSCPLTHHSPLLQGNAYFVFFKRCSGAVDQHTHDYVCCIGSKHLRHAAHDHAWLFCCCRQMSDNNSWIKNLASTAIICAAVGYTAHHIRGGMVESSRELGRSHEGAGMDLMAKGLFRIGEALEKRTPLATGSVSEVRGS